MPLIARRNLLIGLASLLAAPAIVRPASLMQIRGVPLIINTVTVADLIQEFTVWGWDEYGMPKKQIVTLTEEEVRAGKWQQYYGHDAQFVTEGRKLAKGRPVIAEYGGDFGAADALGKPSFEVAALAEPA
jgi:hypothetical protein